GLAEPERGRPPDRVRRPPGRRPQPCQPDGPAGPAGVLPRIAQVLAQQEEPMNALKLLPAALLALVLASPAAAFGRLGGDASKILDFGKRAAEASEEISEAEEIEHGEGIDAQLLGAAPTVNDPGLQRYVNRVGLWLALQSERPNLPWRFGVMDSDDVNAFALPGGIVLITRGLYERLRDESELAGVLGHEISHVVAKDQVKAIKKA